MKKTKIIITICMVAVLMMTLCVSTFASGNVLQGEEGISGVDTTEPRGIWVFNNTLSMGRYELTIYFTSNNASYIGIETGIGRMTYIGEDGNYSAYSDKIWNSEEAKTIAILNYDTNQKTEIIEFLNTYATKTAPIVEGSCSVGILDVASEIPTFLTTGLTTVTALFYTDGELSFLGYLAIASLAISVCFLVISIIRNFLHFRG